MKAISSIIATAIGQYVGASVKTDQIKIKVVDTLVSEGITSEMLVAPKNGTDASFYDSVKAAVVAGFAVNVQTLLGKDTKTLSDAQKSDKRYWQQQVGSKIKDLRNALMSRGARGNVTLFEVRLKRDLAKYIAQIEKGEAFEFAVVEMLKHLKNASVLIK